MKLTTKNELTEAERIEFAECEAGIKEGFSTFYETGMRFIKISDKRLYRETHSTFEEYCAKKWNMTARRAYQLCQAAEVISKLPESANHGSETLINERQARELANVPEEKRAKVLKVATKKAARENVPVTANAIKEAAAEVCPPKTKIAPVCDEDETLIQDCIEVIRAEQKASVCLLQRRLRLGYARADRIMGELENRGIVGPAKGVEPRDILIDLESSPKTPAERNDEALLKAWGGKLPGIPDAIKAALAKHQADTVHAFKVAVGKLIADLPKNVDTFELIGWLHGQANLLSNRRDQQKHMKAYTA